MTPEAGSNSIAADQILSIIERAENIHAQRKELGDDLKDIFAEARSNGFNAKAIQHLIKIRAEDPAKRADFRAQLEIYASAIGVEI